MLEYAQKCVEKTYIETVKNIVSRKKTVGRLLSIVYAPVLFEVYYQHHHHYLEERKEGRKEENCLFKQSRVYKNKTTTQWKVLGPFLWLSGTHLNPP
jgi:hypothetical protein